MLSDEKLEEYMSMLPPDLNETRRAVIQYALESVGTIPYYYGGKSRSPGYQDQPANNFGIPLSEKDEDHEGRRYWGLDCSGWIYWVRWSVTGNGEHHSTGTWQLSKEGRATTIGELKPGDILDEVGNHVVMFLAYQGDKEVFYIQESGGIGNINVQKSTRKSLEDYYTHKRNLDVWYGDGE